MENEQYIESGLSVGTTKIANKYEIFTEEEVDIINNKIPELDERVGVIEGEVDFERKRIDNLATLEEGSTTGDAELIDGRIGADGVIYENIGSAIRNQLNNVVNVEKSPNIFNVETALIDKYYSGKNGEKIQINDNKDYACVKIPCNGNEEYICSRTDFYVYFLDGTDTVLSNTGSANGISNFTFTTPHNAKYFVLSWGKNIVAPSIYMCAIGNRLPTSYVPFYENYTLSEKIELSDKLKNYTSDEIVDARIGNDGESYENIGDAIRMPIGILLENKKSLNLFNKDDIKEEYYYNGSVGAKINLETNTAFACIKISCEPQTKYTCSRTDFYIHCLDKDNNVISRIGSNEGLTNYTFITPNNCKYFTISWGKNIFSANNYMCVEGETLPTDYIPFGNKYYLGENIELNEKAKDYINNVSNVYEEYHVGVGQKYNNFTQLLKMLKDNKNNKKIYVHGGTYDIFEEYGGTEFAKTVTDEDCTKWAIYVPKNTHIIGLGRVIFNYLPEPSQTTINCSRVIAPLNVNDSCTIENIEIHCKNSRYGIHDETGKEVAFRNGYRKYKNVRVYLNVNDEGYGFVVAYGNGFQSGMTFEFEDCIFETKNWAEAFSMHNNGWSSMAESSNINIKNCVFLGYGRDYSIRFGNLLDVQAKNNVMISSSYLKGASGIYINTEDSNPNVKNAFDVTVINCNSFTGKITTTNNIYPIKIYN